MVGFKIKGLIMKDTIFYILAFILITIGLIDRISTAKDKKRQRKNFKSPGRKCERRDYWIPSQRINWQNMASILKR